MSLSCPSWCSCAASGLHKGGSRLWSNRQMYPLEPCSKLWHPKSLSDNDSCCSHYILLVWASATTKKTEGSWVNWWMYARLQQQLNTYPNFTMFPVRTGRCDSPCLFCVYCLVHLQKPRALSLRPFCTLHWIWSRYMYWNSRVKHLLRGFCEKQQLKRIQIFKGLNDFSPGQHLMSIRLYTFVIFRQDWSDLWWVSGPRCLTSSEPSRLTPLA